MIYLAQNPECSNKVSDSDSDHSNGALYVARANFFTVKPMEREREIYIYI